MFPVLLSSDSCFFFFNVVNFMKEITADTYYAVHINTFRINYCSGRFYLNTKPSFVKVSELFYERQSEMIVIILLCLKALTSLLRYRRMYYQYPRM